MIKITKDVSKVGNIWIGNSSDEEHRPLQDYGISGILCVAQDMVIRHSWDGGFETMQVGLIDGPGNEIVDYCAAILALHTLSRRCNVLVCCHGGSRSVSVALMYLALKESNIIERVDFLRRHTWSEMFDRVEKISGQRLPVPHEAHIKAFNKIPFGVLEVIL